MKVLTKAQIRKLKKLTARRLKKLDEALKEHLSINIDLADSKKEKAEIKKAYSEAIGYIQDELKSRPVSQANFKLEVSA